MHDLTNFKNLRSLLKHFRVWTKKRLGQHFLTDRSILEKTLQIANVKQGEYITEIGAGHGVLTLELLKARAIVDAIEIDRDILPVLHFTTKNHASQLEIHEQHILSYEQKNKPYKIVANIPYQLTSPILRKFLPEAKILPTSITLLIQKEMAEKICNTRKKSLLSLIVAVFGKASLEKIVSHQSFFPPPKVDSAILHIKIYNKPKITVEKEKFYKLLKIGFLHPRKMLKNVLENNFNNVPAVFQKYNIPLNARAENLEINDWENLTREFYA